MNEIHFNELREDLLGTVTEVSGSGMANLDSGTLCSLLLNGRFNMNMMDNRKVIDAKINYIEITKRLK